MQAHWLDEREVCFSISTLIVQFLPFIFKINLLTFIPSWQLRISRTLKRIFFLQMYAYDQMMRNSIYNVEIIKPKKTLTVTENSPATLQELLLSDACISLFHPI